MKLNKPYDHDDVKALISKHLNKPFNEVSMKEFSTYAAMWYAMFIEFADTDIDINFEVMKMQTILKQQLWKKD